MDKKKIISILKSLKEDCPTCSNNQVDFGYNKAMDTACSIIEAYS